MKIKAIEEQGYYNLNGMAITTGNVYEGEPYGVGSSAVVVVGDDGGKVFLLPDEFTVEEE